MTRPYITVSALTKYIQRKFQADPYLKSVVVKGEVSNVNYHTSGTLYVTLKDDDASIRVIMFQRDVKRLAFEIENGMSVYIEGFVDVYERFGAYQLYAQSITPDGVGALHVAYEQLVQKLKAEGLFDPSHKRTLPAYPQVIGVVTSRTGAVIRDIVTTVHRRYPLAQVVLFEATVQGERAAPSIVQAIERAERANVDVLIVGRGGGSIEDLWAFNEEVVARALFHCSIPTISAVGHETDTTIADFVADLRAPTPTAAAEMSVPSSVELLDRVKQLERALTYAQRSKIGRLRAQIERFTQSVVLTDPLRMHRPHQERLNEMTDRLMRTMREQTDEKRRQLVDETSRLQLVHPRHKVELATRRLQSVTEQMTWIVQTSIGQKKREAGHLVRLLSTLNPLHVIERGFTLPYKGEDVITSVEQVDQGDELVLAMKDGKMRATVTSVEKEGNES